MKNIKEYSFVDCLLVDFGVDKTLSNLFVIIEAYYPLLPDQTRKKGLLKIIFKGIKQLHLEKNDEFDFDLLLSYDEFGNDVKANEFYSAEIFELGNNLFNGIIHSDMLKMEVKFERIELEEI